MVTDIDKPLGRELLVLRHAKSAWNTDARTDFERPLSGRGRRDAPRMGRWMRLEGLVPDHVVCSPARRAKQTALSALEVMELDPGSVLFEDRIYDAGLDDLIDLLAECPQSFRRVMLVGHNPGLEELVFFLCGEVTAPDDGKLLPTATLARITMPPDWRALGAGAGRLLSVTRPKSLPRDA
ncbi:MAG: SixA phosphatase family protein [Planctomycetota bacterium]|jgi:phosphohistidine phosphatase